jgi:hypothetical protein
LVIPSNASSPHRLSQKVILREPKNLIQPKNVSIYTLPLSCRRIIAFLTVSINVPGTPIVDNAKHAKAPSHSTNYLKNCGKKVKTRIEEF